MSVQKAMMSRSTLRGPLDRKAGSAMLVTYVEDVARVPEVAHRLRAWRGSRSRGTRHRFRLAGGMGALAEAGADDVSLEG